jgi:hypothetical protein
MKSLRIARLMVTCAVVAGAFAPSPGCSSTPEAHEAVQSMGAFNLEIAKVKDSIDSAVKSLETVVASQPSEIGANLEAFSKSRGALEQQAKVVRGRAEDMKSTGDAFFKGWEPPKGTSPERRAQLTSSYAKIKEEMARAKDGFTPFLNSLKDIENYLKLDPTTTGINSMAEQVKKAKENGAHVKSSIDAVLNQVNSVQGVISTKPS